MFARSLPLVLTIVTSALAASACLDIEQTLPSASGGKGGGSTASGGAGNAGGSGFTPTPCLQTCIDRTPAGAAAFLAVAACNSEAVIAGCAAACAEDGLDDGGGPECPVPGTVDPSPPCNACLKRSCCPELQGCFADVGCITVGICASGCE